jgi:hypothetical protein
VRQNSVIAWFAPWLRERSQWFSRSSRKRDPFFERNPKRRNGSAIKKTVYSF